MGAGTVEISLETYETMMQSHQILGCLRAAGVDNWEGYDDALGEYYNDIEREVE